MAKKPLDNFIENLWSEYKCGKICRNDFHEVMKFIGILAASDSTEDANKRFAKEYT